MIPSPASLKLTLLVLSLGVHCAVLFFWFAVPKVDLEGGAGAVVEARLGNSFSDLAAGVAQPTEPEEVPPELPEEITEPQPQQTPVTPAQPPAPQPEVAAVPEAITPDLATVPLVSADPVEVTPTETPEITTAQTVEPTETVDPEQDPPDTITPVSEAPSLRPKVRPERPPEPPRRTQTARQGNSNQNTTTGSATGNQTATAAQKSTRTGQSTEAGNAAASNYPGKVMRKISRIRKPRTKTNGTTVIQFAIASSGALQSARVAQSSGSQQFDRAVLQIVQRAAPFPAPPPGARRNFSVKFSGRG